MKYKKSQVTIFIIIGILVVAAAAVFYFMKSSENDYYLTDIEDVDERVRPLKLYLDECYFHQQKVLLTQAGIIDDLKDLGYYKDYFKKFIIENSLRCIENIPLGVKKEFITDPLIKDVKTILPNNETIFVLKTQQEVLVDEKNTKELGNYIQKHDVYFLKLHNHTTEIDKSDKVRFTYLSKKPINNYIYRIDDKKQYIINDSVSEINLEQYLFLFETD